MKNYNIIGVSGKKRSGKDEFYTTFNNLLPINKRYTVKKYADKLKKISSILTGKPEHMFYDHNYYDDKLPEWGDLTHRQFLQKLGTEAVRMGLHNDAWVIALFSDYSEFDRWMVTDVRFPNESAYIKRMGGILIRINRNLPSNITDTHSSETALDDYKDWDFIINNDKLLFNYQEKIKKLYYEYWNKNNLPNIPIIL